MSDVIDVTDYTVTNADEPEMNEAEEENKEGE